MQNNMGNTLETYDGLQLHSLELVRDDSKASILLLPGYRSSIAASKFFINSLHAAGFNIWSFDLRGHGDSAGERYKIRSLDDIMDDLDLYWFRIKERIDKQPIFLMGENISATILINFLISRAPRLSGLVCLSPTLELPLPKATYRLLPLLARIMPGRELAMPPSIVSGAASQSATGSGYSYETAHAVVKAAEQAIGQADELSCAMLLVANASEVDKPSQPINVFYERVMSFNKKFVKVKSVEDYLLAGSKVEPLQEIIAWLDEHYSLPLAIEEDELVTGPL